MIKTLLLIENSALSVLVQDCLKSFPGAMQVVGRSKLVAEGFDLFSLLKPDLVVVSEQLADGEGMQFLRLTGSTECDRVFLCRTEDAWFEALRYGAVAGKMADDRSDLDCISSAIGHVIRRRGKSLNDQCSEYFTSCTVTSLDQIAMPTAEGLVWVKRNQIKSLIPYGRLTKVLTHMGQLDVQRSIRQLARVLRPMGFDWDSQGHLLPNLGINS